MYEKSGLMVRITNPKVLAYLRNNAEITNKQLIEEALREKVGLPPKNYDNLRPTRKKIPDCLNGLPVKISDQDIIDFILFQNKRYGILQKFIVENAILEKMERENELR